VKKTSPQSYNFIDERVKLDVGGVHYSVSLRSLTYVSGSLLAKLARGEAPSEKSKEGRIFIDRDGRHFRHIANFLRDPQNFKVRIKDKNILEQVKNEAVFFWS